MKMNSMGPMGPHETQFQNHRQVCVSMRSYTCFILSDWALYLSSEQTVLNHIAFSLQTNLSSKILLP